ncbi:winged helix-turn-helix domain-containing protein [Sphingomonas aracearum]|uniref:Transcriptional regulator n=1 Tax=Sphingomonas aracearum TaxID=2283317 RepID=A0A369VYP0_9SPHN|nr:transcriptional regulator [Sphingomonas aracearum]RDE06747.1 transcriptional regulator [Sphingomonas aracearum]
MARFRFDNLTLDEDNRRLTRDGAPVELNARYLDALVLLVREAGQLVTKDRFLAEVWRGVPVTDEALTQCIRTLRRALGDDAARPRFIETVPKHGYRFIAPVCRDEPASGVPAAPPARDSRLLLASGGTLGAGGAGVIGGLLYGIAAAAVPGAGAASALLVVLCLTVLMALIGGAGVTAGLVLAGYPQARWWQALLGGAVGGLVVGGTVKLLGLDAFNLLFGAAPAGITGGPEGAVLGAGAGVGAWLARRGRLRRTLPLAALAGAASGLAVPLTGGRLMAGSLALLSAHFPGSRLRLDGVGRLFGEISFGAASQLVTAALEGALFATCIAAGLAYVTRGSPAQE